MRTVVKLLFGEYTKESRDKREVAVLLEIGTNVIILQPGDNQGTERLGDRCELRIKSLSPVPIKLNRINRKVRMARNWLVLVHELRILNADLISCHDLPALCIGWMSTWFKSKENRPKLVYDAHEFEVGRNTNGKRSRFIQWLIPKAEKFLMKRCVFSIMVNDSIANAVQEAYHLKERPVVVRSIPPYWDIDEEVCKAQRRTFSDQLGVSYSCTQIMYWGGIVSGRGIETLLQAICGIENCVLILMGDGESKYLEWLKQQAMELGVAQRVLFHAAVPSDAIWQYSGAVDISMVTIPAVCQSYYYMLPNKFFESIQSLTPIIASAFPEVGRVVKEYDIGLLVNPESVEEIVHAIETMRTDASMYARIKSNLKTAKEELCWENEKQMLKKAYRNVISNHKIINKKDKL